MIRVNNEFNVQSMISKQNRIRIQSLPTVTGKVGRVAKGDHGIISEPCFEFTALDDEAGNLTIGGAIKGCRLVQKVIGESHNTAAPFRTVLTAGQYARFITDGVCTIQRIVE